MYEARPWFGGIAEQPSEVESIAELREMFKRTNLVEDLSFYFLYEAADAILRINNCNLALEGLLLEMIPEFYQAGTQLQRFNQLFADQPIDRNQLWLTIPEEIVQKANKSTREIITRYTRNGIVLVLDGYHPAELPLEELAELGITRVRLSPELYLSQETANQISALRLKGITVLGGKADTPDTLAWLIACGVKCSSGTMTGMQVNEDELILDSLAREQV